jgi:hypothetical protein
MISAVGIFNVTLGVRSVTYQETARLGRDWVRALRSAFVGSGLWMGVAAGVYTIQSKSTGDDATLFYYNIISEAKLTVTEHSQSL